MATAPSQPGPQTQSVWQTLLLLLLLLLLPAMLLLRSSAPIMVPAGAG
jgi:hypothetical protein